MTSIFSWVLYFELQLFLHETIILMGFENDNNNFWCIMENMIEILCDTRYGSLILLLRCEV